MKVFLLCSIFTIFSFTVYSQEPASASNTKAQKEKELMDEAEKKCVESLAYQTRLGKEGREVKCKDERVSAETDNKQREYIIMYLVEHSSAVHPCKAQDGTNGTSTVQFSSPPRR